MSWNHSKFLEIRWSWCRDSLTDWDILRLFDKRLNLYSLFNQDVVWHMLLFEDLMWYVTFVNWIHLIVIRGCKLSLLRASRTAFGMISFDCFWYWFDPLLLFSFWEHVQRDLDHVWVWIISESLLALIDAFKKIYTLHGSVGVWMQMTHYWSLDTEAWLLILRWTFLLLLLDLMLACRIRTHIDHNPNLFFSNISSEFLN